MKKVILTAKEGQIFTQSKNLDGTPKLDKMVIHLVLSELKIQQKLIYHLHMEMQVLNVVNQH